MQHQILIFLNYILFPDLMGALKTKFFVGINKAYWYNLCTFRYFYDYTILGRISKICNKGPTLDLIFKCT